MPFKKTELKEGNMLC